MTKRGQRLEDVGTNPDPRFSLANERTFLAWSRTALALIAAGLAGALAVMAIVALAIVVLDGVG